ncbi:MAG: hypothetical protein WDM81_15890 [Rhizomicrobium sp.]
MNGILRAGGLAAILGGSLRIADSFATNALPQGTLALLYLVTDVFLLAGIAGLWVKQRAGLRIAGTIGLAMFVVGILLVRASAFGAGTYQAGATVALLGLAVYSVESLLRRISAAPVLWLGAFAAGIAGAAGLAPGAMTVLAGVAFGLGFVMAGIETIYGAPQSAQTATSTVT